MKWLNNSVSVLLLVSIGFIVLGLSVSQRLDWSDQSFFTLSEQSRTVINELETPISLVSFYKSGTYEYALVLAVLESYQRESDLVKYTNIDPEKESLKMVLYEGADNGSVIIENRSMQRLTIAKRSF